MTPQIKLWTCSPIGILYRPWWQIIFLLHSHNAILSLSYLCSGIRPQVPKSQIASWHAFHHLSLQMPVYSHFYTPEIEQKNYKLSNFPELLTSSITVPDKYLFHICPADSSRNYFLFDWLMISDHSSPLIHPLCKIENCLVLYPSSTNCIFC